MVALVATIVTAVPPASGATRVTCATNSCSPWLLRDDGLRQHLHACPARRAAASRARYPAAPMPGSAGCAPECGAQPVELIRQEPRQRACWSPAASDPDCTRKLPQIAGDGGQRVPGGSKRSAGSICASAELRRRADLGRRHRRRRVGWQQRRCQDVRRVRTSASFCVWSCGTKLRSSAPSTRSAVASSRAASARA